MNTDIEAIRQGLRDVFVGANVFDVAVLDVAGNPELHILINGESVQLRYRDLPRIVEILGTERINFQSQAGADVLDSYTFDGVVVLIHARPMPGNAVAPEQP
jgi:hypothetical protein